MNRKEIISNINKLIDEASGDPTHIILFTYISALKDAKVIDEKTHEYIWEHFAYNKDKDSFDWACDVLDGMIKLNKLYEIVQEVNKRRLL